MDASLLLAVAQNPQLPSVVLGVAVPWIYRSLAEGGLDVPSKLKVWLNIALCTAVSFVPFVASWVVLAPPSAEQLLSSISAAFLVSEISYRQFLKPQPQESPEVEV